MIISPCVYDSQGYILKNKQPEVFIQIKNPSFWYVNCFSVFGQNNLMFSNIYVQNI